MPCSANWGKPGFSASRQSAGSTTVLPTRDVSGLREFDRVYGIEDYFQGATDIQRMVVARHLLR
jgi:hypothetical protein